MPPIRAALRRAPPTRKYRKIAIAVAVTLGLASLLAHAFREPPGPPARHAIEARAAVAAETVTAVHAAPAAVHDCGRSAAKADHRRPGAFCPSRTLQTELIIAIAE
jgi:hypothetical protein